MELLQFVRRTAMTSMVVEQGQSPDELMPASRRGRDGDPFESAPTALSASSMGTSLWASASARETEEWALRGFVAVSLVWTGLLAYVLYAIIGNAYA
jgi:hypothetical protein